MLINDAFGQLHAPSRPPEALHRVLSLGKLPLQNVFFVIQCRAVVVVMLNSSHFGPFLPCKTLSRSTVYKLLLLNLLGVPWFALVEINIGVFTVIFQLVTLISIAQLYIASIALKEGHSAAALGPGSLVVAGARLLPKLLLSGQCC